MAIKNNGHEIISNLLKFILIGGAVAMAMTSPYFLTNILFKKSFGRNYKNLKEKKKFYNTFYYLKRKGFIEIENINNQIRREAFRGKLKELGFVKLQESVWAHGKIFTWTPSVQVTSG